MSEVLEALHRLYLTNNTELPYCKNGECLKDYELVEKELKRLEQLEIMYSNCVIEGAKQNKALKIIISKKVNVGEFLALINKDTTYEQYEYLYENRDKILGDSLTTFNAKLSKREFEAIKESILCH